MSQVSIQVLCVESIDSITSLIITTTNHRIIVNCGESIQRLCIEHKIKLSKVSAILITNFTPQSFLGLPGNKINIYYLLIYDLYNYPFHMNIYHISY